MNYYLSIDGGGTKTVMLLTDDKGRTLSKNRLPGCAYPQIGLSGLSNLLNSGVDELVLKAGLNKGDITSVAWGIPCYGESAEADLEIKLIISSILPNIPNYIGNDVEIGHAGSLALEPGIHIVAGTGAIGFGKNSKGDTARCNGSHEDFSDEGSAYWLGIQTLRLFVKQSDGREQKGPLYDIVKKHLSLRNDIEVVSYYNRNLAGNRAEISKLQMLLYEAAVMGDRSAADMYDKAAFELFLTVKGLYYRLSFDKENETKVSYFGGVYKAGDFVLAPFSSYLKALRVRLAPPVLTPASGGILLAAAAVCPSSVKEIISNRKIQEAKTVY